MSNRNETPLLLPHMQNEYEQNEQNEYEVSMIAPIVVPNVTRFAFVGSRNATVLVTFKQDRNRTGQDTPRSTMPSPPSIACLGRLRIWSALSELMLIHPSNPFILFNPLLPHSLSPGSAAPATFVSPVSP
jgi:hypothetical protein